MLTNSKQRMMFSWIMLAFYSTNVLIQYSHSNPVDLGAPSLLDKFKAVELKDIVECKPHHIWDCVINV